MCTGPFKLDSWKTGEGVTVVKNDAYWDTVAGATVAKITFKGVPGRRRHHVGAADRRAERATTRSSSPPSTS